MKNRALYSLIPLVFLLGCPLPPRDTGGRAAPAPQARKPDGSFHTTSYYKCFERDKCRINVTVTACAVGGIKAHPEVLGVAPRVGRTPIVWTLRAPPGYSFAPDGINFKNKDLASTQFRKPESSSQEFRWEDQNTKPGQFPYNIKVKHGTTDCPVYDPILVNEDTDAPNP